MIHEYLLSKTKREFPNLHRALPFYFPSKVHSSCQVAHNLPDFGCASASLVQKRRSFVGTQKQEKRLDFLFLGDKEPARNKHTIGFLPEEEKCPECFFQKTDFRDLTRILGGSFTRKKRDSCHSPKKHRECLTPIQPFNLGEWIHYFTRRWCQGFSGEDFLNHPKKTVT